MFSNPYVLAVITAAGAAIWPNLAKASGAEFSWIITCVYLSPFLIGLLSLPGTLPPLKSIPFLVAVFCTGGLTAAAYVRLLKLPQEELSRNLNTVAGLVPLFLLLGGWLFLNETMEMKKVIGVLAIMIGIFLIKPS